MPGTELIKRTNKVLGDDDPLYLGAGLTVKLQYQTDDDNANMAAFIFPEGGGTDVPVLLLADVSGEGDNGFGNGITEPTLMILNDAADAYVSLDAGDSSGTGLNFRAAADEDVTLIKLSNTTGAPTIIWDETKDMFQTTHSWYVFRDANVSIGYWMENDDIEAAVYASSAGYMAIKTVSADAMVFLVNNTTESFRILSAGSLVFPDTRALTTGAIDDDYFRFMAVDNDDQSMKEVGRVAGAAGTAQYFGLGADGAGIKVTAASLVGFFGTTPAAQQTKATHNDWAAVGDIVNALVSLGLFDTA